MHNNFLKNNIFFLLLVCLLGISYVKAPIGDFGNYYYGSKLFINNQFDVSCYSDISRFNDLVSQYEKGEYFLNYATLPPCGLLFYIPFIYLESSVAKLIFNILSLLLFCYSSNKLFKQLGFNSFLIAAFTAVFIIPLYNNFINGQTYIVISSFIIEAFLSSRKQKYLLSSILLSISISLKLFPIVLLLYFMLRKEYKVILYTFLFVLLIQLATLIFVGWEIVGNYYLHIFPRLLNNDIIGKYYHNNQSILTVLLHMFSYDALNNTSPLVNLPILIPIILSGFVGLVLAALYQFRRETDILMALTLFSLVLITNYNTTYASLILFPAIILLTPMLKKTGKLYLFLILVFLALNLHAFTGHDSLKFSRIVLLLIGYCMLISILKTNLSIRLLLLILLPILAIQILLFRNENSAYFQIQNTTGILYDFTVKNDTIVLHSTLGHKKTHEFYAVKGKFIKSDSLKITKNILYYKNRIIENSSSNKKILLYTMIRL